MTAIRKVHWVALVLAGLLMPGVGRAAEDGIPSNQPGPSIIGIDHMPTAVGDLEHATQDYRRLGFAIKPGRLHDDGLRNNHVKFGDGAGLELISPTKGAADALASHDAEHLRHGDGPAYISLHARDTARLTTALEVAGFRFVREDGGIVLQEPALAFLFFGQGNRSPGDRPEHLAHSNSAFSMGGVWLALDDVARARMKRLLLALDAVEVADGSIPLHGGIDAEVFQVQNGRIAIVPARCRLHAGGPILGVEFGLRDAQPAVPGLQRCSTAAGPSRRVPPYLVPPTAAHGLWLALNQAFPTGLP